MTAQAAVDPAAAAFVLSLYSLNIGGTGEAVPEFDSDLDVSLTLAFTQPDVRRTRTFNLVKEGGQWRLDDLRFDGSAQTVQSVPDAHVPSLLEGFQTFITEVKAHPFVDQ